MQQRWPFGRRLRWVADFVRSGWATNRKGLPHTEPFATSWRAPPPETVARTPLPPDRRPYRRFPGERVRGTVCEAGEWPPSALPPTCSFREPVRRMARRTAREGTSSTARNAPGGRDARTPPAISLPLDLLPKAPNPVQRFAPAFRRARARAGSALRQTGIRGVPPSRRPVSVLDRGLLRRPQRISRKSE